MSVCAIVPAGGLGTRMGGAVPKQFLNLNGKPMAQLLLKENCTVTITHSLSLIHI